MTGEAVALPMPGVQVVARPHLRRLAAPVSRREPVGLDSTPKILREEEKHTARRRRRQCAKKINKST